PALSLSRPLMPAQPARTTVTANTRVVSTRTFKRVRPPFSRSFVLSCCIVVCPWLDRSEGDRLDNSYGDRFELVVGVPVHPKGVAGRAVENEEIRESPAFVVHLVSIGALNYSTGFAAFERDVSPVKRLDRSDVFVGRKIVSKSCDVFSEYTVE